MFKPIIITCTCTYYTHPLSQYIYMYIYTCMYTYTFTCTLYTPSITYTCYYQERKKERKKERHLRQWKNEKMTVASGGIRTHDTLYSRQMLYQLSYQGSHVHIHVYFHICVHTYRPISCTCTYILSQQIYIQYLHNYMDLVIQYIICTKGRED